MNEDPVIMPPQTRYKQEQRFWDDIAATGYESLSAYDQERILGWINWLGDGKVLDIGGGSGMVSRLLDGKPGTESVCLDISHKMLRHSPVSPVQADALRLPPWDADVTKLSGGERRRVRRAQQHPT